MLRLQIPVTARSIFSTTHLSKPRPVQVRFIGNTSLSTLDPKQHPLTEPLGENFTEAQHAATLIHGRGFHKPFHHPRTHDIPVANIQFRSYHTELLDLFTHFATHTASALGIPVSRVVTLPTKRTLWTVPRSPHVHKKSQENFERKVYKRAIKAWDAHPDVVDKWCQYLRKHALAGVGLRVTRWQRMPLGIGKKRSEEAENELRKQGDGSHKGMIKTLGDKIVAEEMATSMPGSAARMNLSTTST